MTTQLRAPFQWFGGKRRWAPQVIRRMGDVEVYAEPFAGSLAVLLAAPQRRREVVCDTDGMIVNAWRGIQRNPAEVARWADWPTFHDDLVARRRWLVQWRDENVHRLREDMDYFDARAAGLWVWAVSNWIGGTDQMMRVDTDSIPHLGRQGVQAPPQVASMAVGAGDRLIPWMQQLAQRLARVMVLNRDWSAAVTPAALMRSSDSMAVGVFLDPPYLLDDRVGVYESDRAGDQVARDAWEWAVEYGECYRIAYACHEDDFEIPEGWEQETMTFAGFRDNSDGKLDAVLFSPACVSIAKQGVLL